MTPVVDSPESTDYPTPPEGEGQVLPTLREAVENALNKTGHTWLQRVAVTVSNGVVILQGKMPNYYLKQLAQVTVMAVPGVELVRNELEVLGGNR